MRSLLLRKARAATIRRRIPKCQHAGGAQWRSFSSFLEHWRIQVQEGRLRSDKAQERVAKRLNRLQQALDGYSNEAFFVRRDLLSEEEENKKGENSSSLDKDVDQKAALETASKTIKEEEKEAPPPLPPPLPPLPRIPRGLYIHGPVGSGKSLLMDTFYQAVDIEEEKKARFHFHAFLADVHARIHQLNQADLQAKGRNFAIDTRLEANPIVRVALQFSQSTTLLCLDEFQVTDVADAMILKQLFETLWAHGTIVVATSNRPPSDLYEGGLNWSYFAPFIDLMERHCIVHSLESHLGDYRKVLSQEDSAQPGQILQLPNNGKFFVSEDEEENQIHQIVHNLLDQVSVDDNQLQSFDLPAGFGRSVTVNAGDPKGMVAVFQFEELCDSDLGSSDYRAIAQHFSVVALTRIPRLDTQAHNRARRFITLVDELYEGNCALMCSTLERVGNAEELFLCPHDANSNNDLVEEGAVPGGTLGLEDVQTQGGQPVSTLASVRELFFAFKRAASRITEMTSQRWWNRVLEEDGWSNDRR